MNKQFFPLILITAAGIFLSSCGNLSKMSLTKRHYRSGYYVDFGKKTNTMTTPSVVNSRMKTKRHTETAERTKPVSSIAGRTTAVSPVEPSIPQYTLPNLKKKVLDNKIVSSNSRQISIKAIPVTNNYKSNEPGNKGDAEVRVNANVSFVVIVLCAIFIPPLGVALMYGINSYFWIDLILTLLFFFPGMIFALIVVLM